MKNLKNKIASAIVGSILSFGINSSDVNAQPGCFRGGNAGVGFGRSYFSGGYTQGYFNGGNYAPRQYYSQGVAYPYYDQYNRVPVHAHVNAPILSPTIRVNVPEGHTAYVTDPNGRTYAISYDGYLNQGGYNQSYNISQPQYYQQNQNYILDANRNGIDDRQEYYSNPNYAPDVNRNGVDDRNEYTYYGPGPVRGIVGGTVIVAGSVVEGVGIVGRVIGQGVESLGRGARHAGERVYCPPARVNHPYNY